MDLLISLASHALIGTIESKSNNQSWECRNESACVVFIYVWRGRTKDLRSPIGLSDSSSYLSQHTSSYLSQLPPRPLIFPSPNQTSSYISQTSLKSSSFNHDPLYSHQDYCRMLCRRRFGGHHHERQRKRWPQGLEKAPVWSSVRGCSNHGGQLHLFQLE
jgi:hypothetical protein